MDSLLKDVIAKYNNIVIFSGAGVSTLSGISDYKNSEMFWSSMREDYYTHQEIMSESTFRKDKELFFSYYSKMVANLKEKEPNKSHYFAKELYDLGKLKGVITQNIDGLYNDLIPKDTLCEIHGNAFTYTCTKCKNEELLEEQTYLSKRGVLHSKCCDFLVKPNVVLYGENFKDSEREKYSSFLKGADCIIVMGTELDVVTHNYNIGALNDVFKVLVNNNKVALKKENTFGYSSTVYDVAWDLEIIGDLNTLL